MPWDKTKNYIKSGHRDSTKYEGIRTITINEDRGIKALIGCPKGKYSSGKCTVGTVLISYLFAIAKGWTEAKGKAWISAHKKKKKLSLDLEEIEEELQGVLDSVTILVPTQTLMAVNPYVQVIKREEAPTLPFSILSQKPLKIAGIMLAEGIWNGVYYSSEEIKKLYDNYKEYLLTLPINMEHNKNPRWGIMEPGTHTKIGWDDILKAITYEAEITNDVAIHAVLNGEIIGTSMKNAMDYIDWRGVPGGQGINFIPKHNALTGRPACKTCTFTHMELSKTNVVDMDYKVFQYLSKRNGIESLSVKSLEELRDESLLSGTDTKDLKENVKEMSTQSPTDPKPSTPVVPTVIPPVQPPTTVPPVVPPTIVPPTQPPATVPVSVPPVQPPVQPPTTQPPVQPPTPAPTVAQPKIVSVPGVPIQIIVNPAPIQPVVTSQPPITVPPTTPPPTVPIPTVVPPIIPVPAQPSVPATTQPPVQPTTQLPITPTIVQPGVPPTTVLPVQPPTQLPGQPPTTVPTVPPVPKILTVKEMIEKKMGADLELKLYRDEKESRRIKE